LFCSLIMLSCVLCRDELCFFRELGGQCLYLMLVPYALCCTLTDDNTWCHRVTGCYTWHDRCISNAKVVDPVDLEVAINYRHRVPSHLGARCLMPKAERSIADVLFQSCLFQFAGQGLPLKEWTQRVEIAYLPTKFHTL